MRYAVWFIVNDDRVEHFHFETDDAEKANTVADAQHQFGGASSAYVIDNDTGKVVHQAGKPVVSGGTP